MINTYISLVHEEVFKLGPHLTQINLRSVLTAKLLNKIYFNKTFFGPLLITIICIVSYYSASVHKGPEQSLQMQRVSVTLNLTVVYSTDLSKAVVPV